MHSRTIVSVLVMIAGLAGPVSAGAACPGHENVSAIIRAWEALEPVRGLRTDLSMEEAECGRKQLVQKLELALGRTVGYKAGLTNPAVQKRFGVTAPMPTRPGLGVTVRYEGLPGNPQVSVRFR